MKIDINNQLYTYKLIDYLYLFILTNTYIIIKYNKKGMKNK